MRNTRDKLNEARYFLERMQQTNIDKDAFRYNLSAFLTAFRSITAFMNIEYQKVTGFIPWYQAMMSKHISNTIVAFFDKQRNRTIHIHPITTRSDQYRFYSPAIDVTKLDPDTPIRFSIKSEVDEQGIPHVQMTMVEDIGKAMIGEASVERLWQFDDLSLTDNPKQKDILTLCTEQLNKLEAIVAECERKFLKM